MSASTKLIQAAAGGVSGAFDLNSFSNTTVSSFEFSSLGSNIRSCWINSTGEFIILGIAVDQVVVIELSTPYDLSTGVISSTHTDSAVNNVDGVFAKDDGSEVYYFGTGTAVDKLVLSSNFDLSSVTSTTFNPSLSFGNPRGLVISSDGTKFYAFSGNTDSVIEYSLSPAYDISDIETGGSSTDFSGTISNPQGIDISTDGKKLYLGDNSDDTIVQFSLSTAFDLSTASLDGRFDFGQNRGTFHLCDEGTKILLCDTKTITIKE